MGLPVEFDSLIAIPLAPSSRGLVISNWQLSYVFILMLDLNELNHLEVQPFWESQHWQQNLTILMFIITCRLVVHFYFISWVAGCMARVGHPPHDEWTVRNFDACKMPKSIYFKGKVGNSGLKMIEDRRRFRVHFYR